MVMPSFLIIGSQSAGTTSVYNYLRQHPQVYLSPVKETNFFVHDGQNPDIVPHLSPGGVTGLAAYHALFQGASDHKAVGEASPLYLVDPQAAARIRHHIPKARLIAILRDPAERAYTAYWMRVRDGRETRSFEQAVDQELEGLDGSLEFALRCYVRWGLYATHLKAYLGLFDRAQLAIHLFDDLRADPVKFMAELFRFVEVDDAFVPDTSVRFNASGLSRSRFLRPLFRKSALTRALRRVLPEPLGRRAASFQEAWRSRELSKPPMSPELRRRLVARYRSDVLELQDMLGRDLSRWLE